MTQSCADISFHEGKENRLDDDRLRHFKDFPRIPQLSLWVSQCFRWLNSCTFTQVARINTGEAMGRPLLLSDFTEGMSHSKGLSSGFSENPLHVQNGEDLKYV